MRLSGLTQLITMLEKGLSKDCAAFPSARRRGPLLDPKIKQGLVGSLGTDHERHE